MTKLVYDVNDRFTVNVDGVDSNYCRGATNTASGSVTATVFSTGPQANPFYISPPGVTANAALMG